LRILYLLLFLSLTLGSPAQDPSPPPALEAQLQRALALGMKGKPGSAAVMDVRSGRLLASWELKVSAQRLVAPGSTLKPFFLQELLRLHRISPEQRLICRRPLFIAGRRMDCSHSPEVADLNSSDAIAYSCNSYFASVATRLTAQEVADLYHRLGVTSFTGLASSEVHGRVSLAQTPAQQQLQALGEWGVLITPLELLSAYRKLAAQRLEAPSAADPVFLGLEHSVQYGMAHSAASMSITAAGKTGTAAGPTTAQTHGLFLGYAPAERPQIVLMVYLEQGRGSDAAAIAGPIFAAYAEAAPAAGGRPGRGAAK
jgi:penicillin-binding protein 2